MQTNDPRLSKYYIKCLWEFLEIKGGKVCLLRKIIKNHSGNLTLEGHYLGHEGIAQLGKK